MKNMKKLTALISAFTLAVSAVPMVSGAEENLMGDMNRDGVINSRDTDLILRYYQYTEELGYVNYYTEEEDEFFHTYGDIDGDGCITRTDAILLAQANSDPEKNTEIGDVNHDGFIDSVDAFMIMEYYGETVTDQGYKYTEEEHENFRKYGDFFNDGIINSIDASEILHYYAEHRMGDLNRDHKVNWLDTEMLMEYYGAISTDRYDEYTEEEHELFRTYGDIDQDGKITSLDVTLLNLNLSDNWKGDIDHDGSITAVDATKIMVYYSDLSTNKCEEYEEKELNNLTLFGDMNNDKKINAIDASIILQIYAENSTS